MARAQSTDVTICAIAWHTLSNRLGGNVYDLRTVLVTGGAGFLGSHLCDRLIADGYRKPIIFMSALPAEQVPLRAKAAGAFGFMRKPFSDERLIDDARSAGCS